MAPFQILVKGQGRTVHPAERAILTLQAQSHQVATQSEASELVTATANALRDMISPHCPQDEATGRTRDDAPISHYSMTTLDTSAQQTRNKETGEAEITFSARADFHIKFQDFAVLNSLATRFSAMDHVRISRINWALTDATLESIKGGTRKMASQDAIQKAYDYAEVFEGVPAAELKQTVLPVRVEENGCYTQSTRPQLHYGKGMRGVQTGRHELQFEPEDVSVEITVNANFVVE